MQYHLFGASTPAGEAFRRLVFSQEPSIKLFGYSRQLAHPTAQSFCANFEDPGSFLPAGSLDDPSLWISFAPVWLLAPFFENLMNQYPDQLGDLRGLIACSSSSALTKRFASNNFDRDLVARLLSAENQLVEACRRLRITCCILRPTLIYGQVGSFEDRNISRLLDIMRRLPVLPIPAQTGLRQPIHCSQLAAVAFKQAHSLSHSTLRDQHNHAISQIQLLTLGGDQELTYSEMLRALQVAQPEDDRARRCLLFPIPNRLFFSAMLPLMIYSPKAFESVLRLGADLAGFTPSHELLGQHPQSFPIQS